MILRDWSKIASMRCTICSGPIIASEENKCVQRRINQRGTASNLPCVCVNQQIVSCRVHAFLRVHAAEPRRRGRN